MLLAVWTSVKVSWQIVNLDCRLTAPLKSEFFVGQANQALMGPLNDQFGLLGLLAYVRGAREDPMNVSLAVGEDLTAFGLGVQNEEWGIQMLNFFSHSDNYWCFLLLCKGRRLGGGGMSSLKWAWLMRFFCSFWLIFVGNLPSFVVEKRGKQHYFTVLSVIPS